MSFNIAIDGPAGAGKSTVAKKVAKDLGFIYVDTGALYRAIAYDLLEHQIDPENESMLLKRLPDIEVEIVYQDGEQIVLLNQQNVNDCIRTEAVSQMASKSSAKEAVRAKLLSLQKDLAKTQNVVMDGRDIGTKVLPDAQLKIYLTAAAKTRGMRRFLEMKEKKIEVVLDEIIKDIEQRDYQDMHRAIAPLCQAEDAVYLDTSDMTAEEAAAAIEKLAKERQDG